MDKATAIFERAEQLAENEDILHRVQLAGLPVVYVKLCRGLDFVGEEYASLVDRFETVAHREGITQLNEQDKPDADIKIKEWRDAARTPLELAQLQKDDFKLWQLPGVWKFAIDPKNTGVDEKWFSTSFNDEEWTIIRSGHEIGWKSQGFAGYGGFVWYRQEIEVPAELDCKHLYLYFRPVDYDAYVYINGEKVLEHSTGFMRLMPSVIAVTPVCLIPVLV